MRGLIVLGAVIEVVWQLVGTLQVFGFVLAALGIVSWGPVGGLLVLAIVLTVVRLPVAVLVGWSMERRGEG